MIPSEYSDVSPRFFLPPDMDEIPFSFLFFSLFLVSLLSGCFVYKPIFFLVEAFRNFKAADWAINRMPPSLRLRKGMAEGQVRNSSIKVFKKSSLYSPLPPLKKVTVFPSTGSRTTAGISCVKAIWGEKLSVAGEVVKKLGTKKCEGGR